MERMALNGEWRCILPDGRELTVLVPGCWDTYIDEKDIGDKVAYYKAFHANIEDECGYYLNFGGVSYYCDVYLNGLFISSHEGIWDNFSLDVKSSIRDGLNEIHLDIWKPGYNKNDRFPLREVLSGFIPDISSTFGGIWDDIHLICTKRFFIERHSAFGGMDGNAEISVQLISREDSEVAIKVSVFEPDGSEIIVTEKDYFILKNENDLVLEFKVEYPILWELHHPYRYSYRLIIFDGEQIEEVEGKLGFREIAYEKSVLLLNKKPVYIRGILHWGGYDELIPLPSRETIREEIKKCKDYGFNMIKHCLYIPRDDYLDLADEMGMLLWIELPLWMPIPAGLLDTRVRREYPRIMKQLSGHPCMIIMSLGCELDAKIDSKLLEEMYLLAKRTSRVLVRDNSGSGECYDGLNVDYADFSDYHFYGELHHMENMMENFTPSWKNIRPWLYGEFCDSDTMRDIKVLRKKQNVERFIWESDNPSFNPICMLKPDFFMNHHDKRLEESGIRSNYQMIKKLSYNHSMVHRKTTLEMTRAFNEICGYNVTSIRDVTIAASGIFDHFMEPKFDKEEFKKFNSDVVLLPAWDLTRIWINADRVMSKERYNYFSRGYYGLHLIVSNYGGVTLEEPEIDWELKDKEMQVMSGRMIGSTIENGKVSEVSYLSMTLPQVNRPSTFILNLSLKAGGKVTENQWPVFIYPEIRRSRVSLYLYDPANVFHTVTDLYDEVGRLEDEQEVPECDIVLASRLTPAIKRYVGNGGKVFYVQRGDGSLPIMPAAFWREGMICYDDHPALGGIHYENQMDDLRFFGVGTDTVFDIHHDGFKQFNYIKSIIKRYDCREWRSDDYMSELGFGSGVILATTLRLEGNMGKQPMFLSNNRFGRWILESALKYLS